MITTIEVVSKNDLLQIKKDLIEEMRKLLNERPKTQEMDYLKSKEVKRILKCSDSTLQYYRESGKLSFTKVGSTYYYTREGIGQLMNSATSE